MLEMENLIKIYKEDERGGRRGAIFLLTCSFVFLLGHGAIPSRGEGGLEVDGRFREMLV
jgi:hypothetical protein